MMQSGEISNSCFSHCCISRASVNYPEGVLVWLCKLPITQDPIKCRPTSHFDTSKGKFNEYGVVAPTVALISTLTRIGYFASIQPVQPLLHLLSHLLSTTLPSPSYTIYKYFHLPPSLQSSI